MRSIVLALALLVVTLGEAQPPSRYAEIRFVGDTPVEIVVDREVSLVTSGGRVRLPGSAGATAYAGASERGVLVALVGEAAVRTVFAPVVAGRLGSPGESRAIERVAGEERFPAGAAVAPTPDGFALFWQEAHARRPSAAYQTYLQRLGPTGERLGPPIAVPAVWPLAAAAYLPESERFYFLLFYGGRGPQDTRLCGVHVDAETLRPMEHPWWASRPGRIDEGQLFVVGDRVLALYRGGPSGQRLLRLDVSEGSWGREAPAARTLGRLGPEGVFGGRLVEGRLEVTTRAAPSR